MNKKSPEAPIFEIFVSYQGEGLFAGQKQIFVRFAGCNLKCLYCDEPAAVKSAPLMSVKSLIAEIISLSGKEKTKVISFTGGEPCLYADFIKETAVLLVKKGFKLNLETNAVLSGKINPILPFLNHVSADIKLPSQSGRKLWPDHKSFIKKAQKKACIKIVVSKKTPLKEFISAVKLIKENFPHLTVFIQPESSEFFPKKDLRPYEKFIKAASVLPDVRFFPQLHKIWNIK